jgi:hypothetical protein
MKAIGKKRWVIAEGYIPPGSTGTSRELTSHEAACILNAGDKEAQITIMIFYKDREPAGPFRTSVPAQRTLHLRFNDLTDPETIPLGVEYSSVIESDVPVVVQHTRLDSRQVALALMSTMAYGSD